MAGGIFSPLKTTPATFPFTRHVDTLTGTVFVLAPCVAVGVTHWQVGGPVEPTACFKKQDPGVVLPAQQDPFRKGTFQEG